MRLSVVNIKTIHILLCSVYMSVGFSFYVTVDKRRQNGFPAFETSSPLWRSHQVLGLGDILRESTNQSHDVPDSSLFRYDCWVTDVKLMSIYYPNSHVWETSSQDWEIVPSDWWRTHYSSVSWLYIQDPVQDKTPQRRQFQGSFFPNPLPHITGQRRAEDLREIALNLDLAGVKGTLETVLAYERSVGFYYQAFPKIEPDDLASLMALNLSTRFIDVQDTRMHQVRWNELLNDLMHSPLADSPSDNDDVSELGASSSSLGDSLLHSTSTLSSVDLTSSEGSLESQPMPSTPRPKSSTHHPIEVNDTSPTGSVRTSPIRSLSASASSFFPTLSHAASIDHPFKFPLIPETSRRSSKLSSFAEFIFPSLNPPVSASSSASTVKLKKDRDGFFTEESPNTTPTALLPPFLQESSQRNSRMRKSRTREIVDRLRSESAPNEEGGNLHKGRHSISPKYASYSPSPQLLDDFAFSLIQPRRSVSEDGSGEQRQHRQTVSTTSFSASVSTSTSRLSTPEMEDGDDDGWIDIAHPTPSGSSPKSKRTRELFLALTRRRTDSISSEVLKETTTEALQGATAVTEEVTDMSISSAPSPSSTPPRTDIIRSVTTSPTVARTGANDGWIETPAIVHDNSPKTQQKEKIPKKETHYRKKSQNSNPGHGTPLWTRAPAFQPTPPPMPPHPPNHPLSSFLPSSTSTAFSHPAVLAPHVMPVSTTTGSAPMPYFFPSYPNIPISSRISPVSPINYPAAAYNVIHVPNAYPMPPPPPPIPMQSYVGPPPPFSNMALGGYPHASQSTPMPPAAKALGFATTHNTIGAPSLSVPVPVGAGYSGLNGSKNKW